MVEMINLQAQVDDSCCGQRLDRVAVTCFQDFSRARLQEWIKSGHLQVDGKVLKPGVKLRGGEQLKLAAEIEEDRQWEPEFIEFPIVYEDQDILIINKPAGLVVHPAPGHWSGTLLNGLLHYCPDLATIPRAGIVHRLDKDTTGLMVVAKTLQAQTHLVEQLQARTVRREYETIVKGAIASDGTVDKPIARHPTQRLRMAVVLGGKPAITHYKVMERFTYHTYLHVKLETGRTHQIRVHMSDMHHPLVGDELYNARFHIPRECSKAMEGCLVHFRRQALHARRLGLIHPVSGQMMSWSADAPEDFKFLLRTLREEQKMMSV